MDSKDDIPRLLRDAQQKEEIKNKKDYSCSNN